MLTKQPTPLRLKRPDLTREGDYHFRRVPRFLDLDEILSAFLTLFGALKHTDFFRHGNGELVVKRSAAVF